MCIIPARVRYRGSPTNRYSTLASCNPKGISTLVSLDRGWGEDGKVDSRRSLEQSCMHTDRCMSGNVRLKISERLDTWREIVKFRVIEYGEKRGAFVKP